MLNRYNPLHMFLASYGNELNRIDYRILKESRNSSSPSSFSYNGLVYSFNPDLNMFVNQFGHAMDYAQAVALAASLGYSEQEFEGLADSTDTDGGTDRRSAPLTSQINFLFAYGPSPYGYPGGVTGWPTQYNDQKGLSYFYPYITYYPGYQGPTPAAVSSGNMNEDTGFTYFGWTGVGTLNNMPGFGAPLSYQYFFHEFPILNEPLPPANFVMGNSAHGSTALVQHIIDGYSWIPSERRLFSPNKLWSAYNQTTGGVTGNEILFR